MTVPEQLRRSLLEVERAHVRVQESANTPEGLAFLRIETGTVTDADLEVILNGPNGPTNRSELARDINAVARQNESREESLHKYPAHRLGADARTDIPESELQALRVLRQLALTGTYTSHGETKTTTTREQSIARLLLRYLISESKTLARPDPD